MLSTQFWLGITHHIIRQTLGCMTEHMYSPLKGMTPQIVSKASTKQYSQRMQHRVGMPEFNKYLYQLKKQLHLVSTTQAAKKALFCNIVSGGASLRHESVA